VRDEHLRHLEAARVETPIGPLDDVTVVSKSDVPIGKLEGIIVDPDERHVRYYVVESRDWFKTHRYLVPDAPHHIDWNRKAMQVELDDAALAKLPELRDGEYPSFSSDEFSNFTRA
jgi:PRC-barrel domain protein